MKIKTNLQTFCKNWFIIFAILIIIGVLFIKPQAGVADQGDFNRIIDTSGLALLDSDINNPHFTRFYDYIVTDYKITDIDNDSETIFASSLSYLIILINTACKLLKQNVFRTQYLAILYSIIYILSFSIILKSLNIKNKIKYLIVSILILFICFDGNYLVWFNSLYGEPMMIVTLILFIASVLNYIYYKYVIKSTEKIMLYLVYTLLAAFLFLGSKLQVSTSLPFIVVFIGKMILDNKTILNKMSIITLYTLLCIVIAYPIEISMNSSCLSKDTQYNSVFYGILNDSKTPEQDLKDLGLNPDMAVEAGKHAYLDSNEYVKYDPSADITDIDFYNKISNSKLVKFYLKHPMRLLSGMKYTASKSFCTSTALGKYHESYSKTPVEEFNRFTYWSQFRMNMLPKNLIFIISLYLIIFLFSLYKYIRNKSNSEIQTKILLLWTIMLISAFQFPMPFVGNGEADTSKQLFLFNYIFDVLLIVIFSYILFKLVDSVLCKLNKKQSKK